MKVPIVRWVVSKEVSLSITKQATSRRCEDRYRHLRATILATNCQLKKTDLNLFTPEGVTITWNVKKKKSKNCYLVRELSFLSPCQTAIIVSRSRSWRPSIEVLAGGKGWIIHTRWSIYYNAAVDPRMIVLFLTQEAGNSVFSIGKRSFPSSPSSQHFCRLSRREGSRNSLAYDTDAKFFCGAC